MLPKRQTIIACLLGAVSIPFDAWAQSPSLPEPAGVQLDFPYVATGSERVPVLSSSSSRDEGPKKSGLITGGVMIFGGGVLYLVGHLFAYRTYDDYEKSAFTEYTDQLRRKLIIYNGMRIGGGVIGGIGIIVMAASF
ncbi:MAG: hypothetical protein JW913_06500 [Chitinispirillaceae bacterium]|nr:hypothetical protein [Chitinispirillaceae bacterium]